VAVVWQVVALDGGPAELSVVAALSAGGMLASTLLGGALADRLPQRHILLGVALTQAVAVALAALLSLTGLLALWHLAAVSLVGGLAAAASTTRRTPRSSPRWCRLETSWPSMVWRAWSGRCWPRPRGRPSRACWWRRCRPAWPWRLRPLLP
jgi:MFS family permease